MTQYAHLPYLGVEHHPCAERCAHAEAVGAEPWASCGDPAYCNHYVEEARRDISEEMVLEKCWLHGPTLWRLDFETLRWSCPLDGCDTRMDEVTRHHRKIAPVLVPPMFGFARKLA